MTPKAKDSRILDFSQTASENQPEDQNNRLNIKSLVPSVISWHKKNELYFNGVRGSNRRES